MTARFVSFFMHGHLAVKSPQIELLGDGALMGRCAFGEMATLWNIGRELTDVSEWRDELAADTAGAAEGVIPGDAVHQVAHA